MGTCFFQGAQVFDNFIIPEERLIKEATCVDAGCPLNFLMAFPREEMLLVLLDQANVLLHHLYVFSKTCAEIFEA